MPLALRKKIYQFGARTAGSKKNRKEKNVDGEKLNLK